jgi:hypothetical protein
MSRCIQHRALYSLIPLAILVAGLTPAWAHEVELAGDVAGTWHVEPDHNPKAGEPAQVWVALTREGGSLLPFDQTNCTLGVYETPRVKTDAPVLQPTLQAINAEQYQGIPGATVTFPKTGIYELTLSCTPKTAAAFQPFEMTYDVVVASGTATDPVSQAVPSSVEAANAQSSPLETVSPVPPEIPNASTPDASSAAAQPVQSLPGEDRPWLWVTFGAVVAVPLALGIGRFLTKR